MARHDVKVVLTADDRASSRLRSAFRGMAGDTKAPRDATEDLSASFGNLRSQILSVAASYVSLRTAFRAFKFGVQVAADMETAQIGLTTLLDSADAAAATIDRLKVEAARTPFELLGLTRATQLLTAVTKDGDKSIDILLDVGESLAAMGKGQSELDRIIVNLQQIASAGRAMSIDIRQFALAGIPIYEMLAEVTGKTGEELADMITQGEITFDLLIEMFRNATDEGGRFAGAFENQQGSFNQSVSNMKDQFAILMSEIVVGTGLFEALTQAVQAATVFMVENKDTIAGLADALIGLVRWLQENREAVDFMAGALAILAAKMAIVQAAMIGKGLIGALASLSTSLGIATAQTGLLQAALMALPVTLTITVALVGFALVMKQIRELKREIGEAAEAQIAAEEMNQRAIERAKEMQASGDEVGAQRLLDTVRRNLNTGIEARAEGGPVRKGRPYLVGEDGPELLVPDVSGHILPARQAGMRMAGAGNISITNNITVGAGADPQEIARAIGEETWKRLSRVIRV